MSFLSGNVQLAEYSPARRDGQSGVGFRVQDSGSEVQVSRSMRAFFFLNPEP
jgi:hypothetical protein